MPTDAELQTGALDGDKMTKHGPEEQITDNDRVVFPNEVLDDISNGLEFQIAIDSLAGGNTDPLKSHLARLAGLDSNVVQIRSTPFEFNKDNGSRLEFVGQMDNLAGTLDERSVQSPAYKPVIHLRTADLPYEYKALNHTKKQIRLLRLGLITKEGIIHNLVLELFDLSAAPQFFALSYVWGQPDKIMSLPCNDGNIMITQNLFRALETSFARYPDVWIWADGISINQDDLIERGHQVAMMGDIYDQAALVIAHTGHHRYDLKSISSREPTPDTETSREHEDTFGIQGLNLATDGVGHQDKFQIAQDDSLKDDEEEEKDIQDGSGASSQPAISLMNYLSRIWSMEDDYSLKSIEEWKKRGIPNISKEDVRIWLRLFEFWSEDWFYRSWVLQEAVLGKKVILLVDDAACSLDFVMQFWDLAKRRDTPEILKHGVLADEYTRILHMSPVSGMKALRDIRHSKETSSTNVDDEITVSNKEIESDESQILQTRFDLLNLLVLSRVNLATDPRDKIYSLLGLARQDPIARSVTPDYSEVNSAAVLFKDIATKFIQAGRGTDLLKHAGVDQKLPGLPSWAPDWTYQSRSTMHSELYKCSGSSISSILISTTDPHKITVRGVVLDEVVYAAMAWRYHSLDKEQEKFAPLKKEPDTHFPPFGDEDAICLIRQLAKIISKEYCTKFDAGEGVEAAMAKTLAMDCSWRLQRTKSDPTFLESFTAFEKLYGTGREEDTPLELVHIAGIFHWVWDFAHEERDRLRTQSWPFEVAVQEAHRGRRFCVTKEGYMCTASYDTEKDDVVAIFEGFRTPFILGKSGNDWKLVGDCYVHGIMDGELIDYSEDIKLKADETSIDVEGKAYSIRLSEGHASFQEFNIL
ncbi:hypothetical protein VTL71DRAFT_4443 [Oculimacula yallundae]|uniref:Heterokaryon incompatibility domain-containing protein n=1 Tax=Oculimacula yallundae TaxID=86028 RepID=A0ABR4C3N9_9HELO